ncbi:MAG: hypothetical protein O2955_07380 [Planctomycetota bacterium]|nr:hypothetical protein [Planctomycetota bacterium]MDA1212320.1 hypothetical protein [Planctomycetota bacterium]
MSKRLLIPALLSLVAGLSISLVHSLLAEDQEPSATYIAPPPLPETPSEVVFEECAGGSLNCAAEESASKVAGVFAEQNTDEQEAAINELVVRLQATERQIESLNEERGKIRELLTKSPGTPIAATIRERKKLVNRLQTIDRRRMELKQQHSQLSRMHKSLPHLVQFYPDFLQKSLLIAPCTAECQDVKTLATLEKFLTVEGKPNVDILRVNRDQPQFKTHGRVDADVFEAQLRKSLAQLEQAIEETKQDIKDKAARARKISQKMHTPEEGQTELEVSIDDEVQHNICMLDLRHSQRVHSDLLKRRSHVLDRLKNLAKEKEAEPMDDLAVIKKLPYFSRFFKRTGVALATEGAAGELTTPILEKRPNLQTNHTAKGHHLYINRSRSNVGVPITENNSQRLFRNVKGPEILQISNEPIPGATQVNARRLTIFLSGDGQVSAVAAGENGDAQPLPAQAQGVVIFSAEGEEKITEPKKEQPKQPQVFKFELKGQPQIRIVEGGEHAIVRGGEEHLHQQMKRLQHLRQAAENLEQAGDKELAQKLREKAEHMEAEVRKQREQLVARMHELQRRQAEMFEHQKARAHHERADDLIAELKEIITDLRHEVRALRKELHELREAIEEDDDDDDDREGDDEREREGDRGDRERQEREQDRDRRESNRPAGDRKTRDRVIVSQILSDPAVLADPENLSKIKNSRRRLVGAQVFGRVEGTPAQLALAEGQLFGDGRNYRIQVLQLNLDSPASDDAVEAKKPVSK